MTTRREIETVFKRWIDAYIRGDAAACAALFTEDGSLLPDGEPAARGRPAVEALHRAWIKGGGEMNKRAESVVVESSGDLAYQVATYAGDYRRDDGSIVTDRGKGVSIYERQSDGSWKLKVAILNSDAPQSG